MRLSGLRGAAALVVTLAAACGSNPKPAPSRPVQAEAPPPEFHGTPVDAPIVTLIDAGHGTRRPLRYAPTRGARGRLEMRMKLHMTMAMLGRTIPVDVPVTTMTMETEVLATSESGFDITAKVTTTDVDPTGADPNVVARVRAAVAKLIGMSTTLRCDLRGVVLAADVQVPTGVDPSVQQLVENFKQSMTQAAAPLPEEAVGAGARWSVASKITSGPMRLDQTAMFALTKRDGDRGIATMEVVQTAPRQTMVMPNTPAGMVATLESLDSKGTGTMTFDLAAVFPAALDMAINLEMQISVVKSGEPPDQAMRATMGMDMGVTMTGAPVVK